LACVNGNLADIHLEFEENAAVCVVLASDGYPLNYKIGLPISGLWGYNKYEDAFCFHAGTKVSEGQVVTAGGRVLGITAKGQDLKEARQRAYAASDRIQFANKYLRSDIAAEV